MSTVCFSWALCLLIFCSGGIPAAQAKSLQQTPNAGEVNPFEQDTAGEQPSPAILPSAGGSVWADMVKRAAGDYWMDTDSDDGTDDTLTRPFNGSPRFHPRNTAYYWSQLSRSPAFRSLMNGLPRKRQILYRQCFFNPISCF